MFDRVIVAVAVNPKKVPLFTEEERKELIREACADPPGVEVDAFHGLLVEYANRRGVNVPCCAACERSPTSSTSSSWRT